MANVRSRTALVRLRLTEARIKRAYDLAQDVLVDSSKKPLFMATVKDLTTLRDHFDADYVTVEAAAENDFDFEEHEARMSDFEEKYFTIMAAIDSLAVKFTESSENVKNETSRSRVALPKITLPSFDGDPKQWINFSNLFSTLITNNKDISPVERLAYLKTSLRGEALGMVQTLPMSDSNFDVAWKLLASRYENKRLIVGMHVDALLQAPSATIDCTKSLRQLLSVITENVAALKALDVPVDQWNLILLPIVCKRLDTGLRTQWELTLSDELPTIDDFVAFLGKHCAAAESVGSAKSKGFSGSTSKPKFKNSSKWSPHGEQTAKCLITSQSVCHLCKGPHALYKCAEFLGRSPPNRFKVAKEHQLCLNCLSNSHVAKRCPSKSSCHHCRARHHTLLHFDKAVDSQISDVPSKPSSPSSDVEQNSSLTAVTPVASSLSTVLLSTAQVHILNSSGIRVGARALLDSASQASFITENCLQRLGLPRKRANLMVHGLSSTTVNVAKSCTSIVLAPRDKNLPFAVDAFVLPKITHQLPSVQLSQDVRKKVSHLSLADPTFDTPGPIDLLIGAELFPQLLTGGKLDGSPTAVDSVFGWILMGRVEQQCSSHVESFCISLLTVPSLPETMRRFWEIEEYPPITHMSAEDQQCERHFVETHSRGTGGRYSVSLPFQSSTPKFGLTRPQAVSRLLRVETRLRKDPRLKQLYSDFMQDYLDSGHMEKIQAAQAATTVPVCYLPHHCVIKPESTTTKLRVVFDASAKGSLGKSLNDTLLTGPKLQRDIVSLLLSFRLHEIVFTADIQQMYRQIQIHRHHWDFQRIVWRFRDDGPIQDFRLKTVTYGVASAPFLALRTLQQLANDEQESFPVASAVLKSDTYVDDIVTGADSVESALELQRELIALLARGGFKLRKFVSNHPAVLDWLPSEDVDFPQSRSLDVQEDHVVKVLGLVWNPATDTFSYRAQSASSVATKRNILSAVARIFDPVGWLAPVVLFVKHLIQALWLSQLGWDDVPSPEIIQRWSRFNEELPVLSSLAIPRLVKGKDGCTYQLHAFCDSSEVGYAAAVYLRVSSLRSEVITYLIAAKSKVAPVKVLSLPRLELCGALLLARLLHHVIELYVDISISATFAWTDSQVVLAWLKTSPHQLKTFVANRVSEIQSLSSSESWKHVRSEDNPADCASRGLLPTQLIGHPLWWSGPSWLKDPMELWPSSRPVNGAVDQAVLEEQRLHTLVVVEPDELALLITRFSRLTKLLRVIAYVYRFIHNTRVDVSARLKGDLRPADVDKSLQLCLHHVQEVSFKADLSALRKGQGTSQQLRRIAPFLDKDGLIRVGGRLHQSNLPFYHKHPLLLPKTHWFTKLVIWHYHEQNHHPGLQALQGILREQYWILADRSAISHCLRSCVRCFRARPSPCQPMMGSLPAMRVQEAKPFLKVGVDYAGPFTIKSSRLRKAPQQKAYLCLFVCCATKALHLELAADLSTAAFLAAYKRFVGRRGRASDIYSDCGTNFVGAHNHLKELQELLSSASHQTSVADTFSPLGITWHFIPPASPHFGGLWEAGVKSVKVHLRKVIGDQILTFEEFYTVLVQVEAVLNSRPLCPLSPDPNDLSALTPGHFLTLEPLVAVPERDLRDLPLNRLQRWQLVEQIHQRFWQRWSREYLHTMQQRPKWHGTRTDLAPHQLVLVKDDRLAPLQWQLGRIVELHPGRDGIARVATVRTTTGLSKRPAVKLCPLPCEVLK